MTTRVNAVIYEFGSFRLNAAERVLLRDGSPVPLAPKVTETLLALVENAGHVVTKDDLMTRLWPDTFVDESNLAQNIFRLRKVLGGESDQAFIETIPRRGYRFSHDVTAISDPDVLVSHRTKMHLVSEEIITEFPEAGTPAAAIPLRVQRPLPSLLVIVTVVTVLFGGAAALMRMNPRKETVQAVPAGQRPASFDKITAEGRAHDPAITPDGRFVAYALLDGNFKSVWLENIATGGTVQIMPAAPDYRGLTFSPDGNELFYKSYQAGSKDTFIARVPMLGGAPQEVARDIWSDFSLSPDGRQVAFIRGSTRPGESQLLMIADVSGGGERIVARQTVGKDWFTLWDSAPSWSPDGQRIALCGGQHDPAGDRDVIFDVQLDDGSMTVMHGPQWSRISQATWLGGSSGLVVIAATAVSKPSQVWRLDYPSGTARRITNDVNDYGKLKLSVNSKHLVVEQTISLNHIWVVREGDAARAKQLTFGSNDSDGLYGLSWTTDGRLLFVSNRTGEYEIWSMNADGSDRRQLTVNSAGSNVSPKMTNDGRYIVFSSSRSGQPRIWRMNSDGSHPIPLTRAGVQRTPDVSPDGRWVYYTNLGVIPSAIEKVSIDGGEPVRIDSRYGGDNAAISPDGKTIAYNQFDDDRGWRNATMPAAGGEPRVFAWNGERGIVRWTPDGRGLVYAGRTTIANLWMQRAASGPPQPITDFKEGHIWNFAISPDGRDYAIYGGKLMSDIVLISDFR